MKLRKTMIPVLLNLRKQIIYWQNTLQKYGVQGMCRGMPNITAGGAVHLQRSRASGVDRNASRLWKLVSLIF